MARWQYHLSECNVEYVHVPGTGLAIPNRLSRVQRPPSQPAARDLVAPVEDDHMEDNHNESEPEERNEQSEEGLGEDDNVPE